MDNIEVRITHIIQESVAIEVPSLKKLYCLAFTLCPSVAVSERCIKDEHTHREGDEQHGNATTDHWVVSHAESRHSMKGKVVYLAQSHDSKVKGRQVMVEEKLSRHQEEWEVV